MISDHFIIIPVFLFAASYTMSQFGRPTVLHVSHDVLPKVGLLVDGVVWLKKYFNDDVDVREDQDAVIAVSVAHWQHHEPEIVARKSPLIKI